jgi:hypothetical protein
MTTGELIRDLHKKMGIRYPLPDLDSRLMILTERAENGKAVCAVKMIGEAYLWLEPGASVRQRVEAIRDVSEKAIAAAKIFKLEDVSAWIPPDIAPKFAHTLADLGWRMSPWPCFSRLLT